MSELHCPDCFKILAEGESTYMKDKSADLPCVSCDRLNQPDEWLTTAQAVELLGAELATARQRYT